MFEQSTLPSGSRGKRVWTTFAGLAGEIALVAVAMLVPIVWPQVLPMAQFSSWIAAPGPPPPPPPQGNNIVRPKGTVRAKYQFHDSALYAYTKMPDKPAILVDEPLEAGVPGVPGGVEGGVEGGVPGGVRDAVLEDVLRRVPEVAPPPKPAAVVVAPPKPVEKGPVLIRRGGEVQMANIIRRVDPLYPPLARQARIQGVVELIGIIATDGHIRQLRVISGHPLLVKAAMDAVGQWLYRPTLLNGEPVEVEAPITVNFRLSQ
jgi:protein TonB